MRPISEELQLERVRFLTRRHFLRQSQIGLGALAFSSLLGRAKPAQAAVEESALTEREPKAVPKARSVIYLHMSGSPPQQDLFDYKPKLVQFNMQPCPDELLKGQRFPFIKGHPNLLGTPYRFRPYGECGTVLSELLPGLGSVVDEIALIRSMWTDQFNHAPAELLVAHRLAALRQRLDGLVDHLRPGFREPEPARLRRLSQRRQRPERRQERLGQRLLAVGLPGRAVPHVGRSDSVRSRPGRHVPRRPPPQPRRASPPQPNGSRRVRRSRNGHADQPVRAGLPHADLRPRRDGHRARAGPRARRVRHAAGRDRLRQQLPPGPAAGRAWRALRAAFRLGLGHARHGPRQRSHHGPPHEVPAGRPADRRALTRSETARPAGRDARDLGRRIRPHLDERSPQRFEALGPRPSSPLLLDVAGRRRHQAGASRSARRTISATSSPRTRSPSTTCRRPC